jgi:hypothetical protein
LFHTVDGAFATTRVVRQPGASGTRRQPCRRSRANYRAPASSMSAQSVRRATWANSDAAIAEPFVGVWDLEDYVHIATSRWLWLTSCRRSLHRNDDGVHADHTGEGTHSLLSTLPETGRGQASLWTAAAAPDHRLWTTLRGPVDPSRLPTCPLPRRRRRASKHLSITTNQRRETTSEPYSKPQSPRRHW